MSAVNLTLSQLVAKLIDLEIDHGSAPVLVEWGDTLGSVGGVRLDDAGVVITE